MSQLGYFLQCENRGNWKWLSVICCILLQFLVGIKVKYTKFSIIVRPTLSNEGKKLGFYS